MTATIKNLIQNTALKPCSNSLQVPFKPQSQQQFLKQNSKTTIANLPRSPRSDPSTPCVQRNIKIKLQESSLPKIKYYEMSQKVIATPNFATYLNLCCLKLKCYFLNFCRHWRLFRSVRARVSASRPVAKMRMVWS